VLESFVKSKLFVLLCRTAMADLHSRAGSATAVQPPLSQAVGYVIVVVVGLVIAFGIYSPILVMIGGDI